MPWGSVIGGIGQAIGGIASAFGGSGGSGFDSGDYQHALDMDYANQERIVKNQPSWIVEGAKNAGLHPLAVLGTNFAQGSTHSIGSYSGGGKDYSWLSDAGQGIGRAAGALLSKEDRAKQQAYDESRMALDLENKQLQNDSIRLNMDATKQDMVRQLARDSERSLINHAQTPGFSVGVDGRTTRSVIDGQNNATGSRFFTAKPPEVAVSHPSTPAAEAGTHPEIKFVRTANGGYTPVRSTALEEALEDDLLGSISWNVRNYLGQFTNDQRFAPPRDYLPSSDHDWVYDGLRGEWYALRKGEQMRNRPDGVRFRGRHYGNSSRRLKLSGN